MNINKHLPYWSQGRIFPLRFEMTVGRNITGWQHPNQTGDNSRPNGHDILFALDAVSLLDHSIGLESLRYYQANPDQKPEIFLDIHMCGWVDVIKGPYAGHLFVPTLTPSNTIHWMDLNSGFNCLDLAPITRR